MGEAGGGRRWRCGVVMGRGWCLVDGRVWGDTRLSLIYATEPCAESLALGAISADSFRSFSFCFFFLMPVLSTWFSVLELKGTYVTLRTFSSSTETVLCTSTST